MSAPIEPTTHPSVAHHQLGGLLRRGWLALLVGLLVGVAAAALITALSANRYTAKASVLVTPTGVNNTATLANSRTPSGTINMDTEAQLVTSGDVGRRVGQIEKTSGSARRLTKPVKVTVPANTEVLSISYEATSATVAAQRANDFASAYLDQRKADAQSALNGEIDKANADLTTLTDRLKSASAQLAGLPPNSAQVSFVRSQRAVLVSQINTLTRKLTGFSTTVVTPGKILRDATTPTSPSSPSLVLNLSAGIAGGLLLGLLAAWLRFAVRHRLRRTDDVAARLHLPVLGAIPPAGGVGAVPKASATFQQYRRIANVVLTTMHGPGVVLVTGQCTARATVAVAGNLARALIASGAGVAVTSASPDELGQWRLAFGSDPAVNDTLVQLPGSAALDREQLSALRGERYLVVAAPDPRGSADAQTAATFSDAVVMVVESRAKAEDAELVLEQLDAVGAPLLGTVLVPSAGWWSKTARKGGPSEPGGVATRGREDVAGSEPSGNTPARAVGSTTAPARKAGVPGSAEDRPRP